MFFKLIIFQAAASLVFTANTAVSAEPSRPPTAKEDSANVQDYFLAVKQELVRLSLSPICFDAEASCTAEGRLAKRNETVKLTVLYNRDTDTVLVTIDKFIAFQKGEKPSLELALKLLTLNGELVTSKLEWDDTANAVRLSTVISTDSNFDRRAFRSQVLGLLKAADKLLSELLPK